MPSNIPSSDSTVILGGGIIGLSTAYYLALANQYDGSNGASKRSDIFVIDPSGASGQSEGALGDFGFKDDVVPLALLS
jgi:glycine/D-amino acid oxidase-like deaminating enzyme